MNKRDQEAIEVMAIRYPKGTPVWIVTRDYYLAIAKDAETEGKFIKAAYYRWKAKREFKKAGGTEYEL